MSMSSALLLRYPAVRLGTSGETEGEAWMKEGRMEYTLEVVLLRLSIPLLFQLVGARAGFSGRALRFSLVVLRRSRDFLILG